MFHVNHMLLDRNAIESKYISSIDCVHAVHDTLGLPLVVKDYTRKILSVRTSSRHCLSPVPITVGEVILIIMPKAG